MTTLYPNIQRLELQRDNCLAFLDSLDFISDNPQEKAELEGRVMRLLCRTYDGLIHYRQQQDRLLEAVFGDDVL